MHQPVLDIYALVYFLGDLISTTSPFLDLCVTVSDVIKKCLILSNFYLTGWKENNAVEIPMTWYHNKINKTTSKFYTAIFIYHPNLTGDTFGLQINFEGHCCGILNWQK